VGADTVFLKSLGTTHHSVESLGLVVVTWTRNCSVSLQLWMLQCHWLRSTGLLAYI